MILKKIINLSRINKQFIVLFSDSVLLISTLFISFSIRLGYWYYPDDYLMWAILAAPIISTPIFIKFGLYRAVIRYIGLKALWSIAQAVSLYALVCYWFCGFC